MFLPILPCSPFLRLRDSPLDVGEEQAQLVRADEGGRPRNARVQVAERLLPVAQAGDDSLEDAGALAGLRQHGASAHPHLACILSSINESARPVRRDDLPLHNRRHDAACPLIPQQYMPMHSDRRAGRDSHVRQRKHRCVWICGSAERGDVPLRIRKPIRQRGRQHTTRDELAGGRAYLDARLAVVVKHEVEEAGREVAAPSVGGGDVRGQKGEVGAGGGLRQEGGALREYLEVRLLGARNENAC